VNVENSHEPTVYVVDNEPATVSALAQAAAVASLRLVTLRNAEELLAQLNDDPPGCVVTELQLPGMSGLDLQRRLREMGSRLTVVIITATAQPGSVATAMKQGAFDLLEIPVDRARATEVILAAIGKNAVERRHQALIKDAGHRHAQLTAREKEVMGLVVRGMSNKQIAVVLKLSEKTVEIHRGRVMHKMAAPSLAELVRMAVVLGDCPLAMNQPSPNEPCICAGNKPSC
jgi:FixJ family two-component response regulator